MQFYKTLIFLFSKRIKQVSGRQEADKRENSENPRTEGHLHTSRNDVSTGATTCHTRTENK